jgi:TolA-binding protein
MARRVVLVAACLATVVLAAAADETPFEIASTLKPSFEDLASLPSRLTIYNLHDDAARATYTCCRPDQEKEILRALEANAAFLHRYPLSSFSDDTLLHNVRLDQVRGNFRHGLQSALELVQRYPDSDLADDAAWLVIQYYIQDKDHEAAVAAMRAFLDRWPESVWADDVLFALGGELQELEDPEGAFAAFDALAHKYPKSEHAPAALCRMAKRFLEVQNYPQVIAVSEELLARYPMSDCVDDAQYRIAEALRHMGDLRGALQAYVDLIERLPGSGLANAAMREANTLINTLRRRGEAVPFQPYDPEAFDPAKEAKDAWEYACHLMNYRRFAEAIAAFREFLDRFPGSDWYDDALYNIGLCYQQQDVLFQEINKAKGPEDLLRLKDQWEDATGAYGTKPTPGQLRAVEDAVGAFALLANCFLGSPLRDEAVYQIARTYVDYGERAARVTPEEAYALQQLLLNFPGSRHEFEALTRLLRFYATPEYWEKARELYGELAAALPAIFPPGLERDKNAFYEFMSLCARHAQFAWMEEHEHHIPYAFTLADLRPYADYYKAAMAMEDGLYQTAAKLLQPLAHMPTHDLHGPALWLLGNCYARLGDEKQARGAWEELARAHPEEGLADDAQMFLAALGSQPALPQLPADLPLPPEGMDYQVLEHVVVFCPWTVSALMRAYNLPNIWSQAQAILEDWTATKPSEKPIVYVSISGGSAPGRPIRLCACRIKDPPDWAAGFAELAANQLAAACGRKLADCPAVLEGLARFAAASLQYDLVTETRDAIGSAAAVVLPQEDVLRTREQAVKAFDEFIRTGAEADKLSADVVCGLLFKLLDVQGLSKERLIDREPYRPLFGELARISPELAGPCAFLAALDRAFGGQARPHLKNWQLLPEERISQRS